MVWSSFIIGLIIGWLIELAIDYFYWRPKRICTDGESNLQAAYDKLKSDYDNLKASGSNTDGGAKRIADLEASIKAKDAEIERLTEAASASLSKVDSEDNSDVNQKEDDLTRIWGIGPKIASVLKSGGITTFEALANTDADQITDILNDAGSNFKLSAPELHESWTEQAKLAADGAWGKLEKLQEKIDWSGQK